MGTIRRSGKHIGRRKISRDDARVKDAKRKGKKVTKHGFSRPEVKVSASHRANKNAKVLAQSGSAEARAFNATQGSRTSNFTSIGGKEQYVPPPSADMSVARPQQSSALASFEPAGAAPIVDNSRSVMRASTAEEASAALNARFKQKGGLQAADFREIVDRYFNIGREFDEEGNEVINTEMATPGGSVIKQAGRQASNRLSLKALFGDKDAMKASDRSQATTGYDKLVERTTFRGKSKEPYIWLGAWKNIADDAVNKGAIKPVTRTNIPAMNSKTERLLHDALKKYTSNSGKILTPRVMFSLATGAAGLWLGNRGVVYWQDKDVIDNYGIAHNNLLDDLRFADTPEEINNIMRGVAELEAGLDETTNPDFITSFKKWVPGLSNVEASERQLKAFEVVSNARKRVVADVINQYNEVNASFEGNETSVEGGSTKFDEGQFWSDYQERGFQQQIDLIRRREESNMRQQEYISRMIEESRQEGLEEQRAYWEERDRKALALHKAKLEEDKKYWEWYWKISDQMRSDNTPSALSFGLL